MFKLALSAGHYLYTAGKRCSKSLDPNETREWWLNDRIADMIQTFLSAYSDIEVLRLDDTPGQKEISLRTRSDASNNWGADLYLAIHHNAGIYGGSGGGLCAYAYNGSVPQSTLDWQKELYNELIKLTGLKGNRSNGCPRASLHEVREPKADAVLLELGFMDSSTDVPIILTQEFAKKCAQACVNVIVKRAKLTKKTDTPSNVAGTYKLIKDVNKYSTAGDAKAKINSKGTMKAGTYYIFSKYPNGYNGMYNLTTDKTGAQAGSWINPVENVVTEVKEEVQKLYRVRKLWTDAKSQVGAFSSIDNAKDACQKAGVGYKVYDWNGKEVYSYIAPVTPAPQPEQPKQETVKKAVYDLDYPERHQIVEYDIVQTEGINEEECTKAIVAIKKNNPNFDIEIAKAFFLLADEYHIDPMRAISQSILETGWFKFAGSSAKAEQHNYCGLGVTGGGVSGASFDTIENGVRAQLQHLFAYGCKDSLPDGETLVDPRFKYVTRGIALYWEQLAGRWAVPGFDGSDAEASMKAETTYGQKINKIYKTLKSTVVAQADVKKYFSENVVEPEVNPTDNSDKEVIDEDTKNKINFIFNFISKLIEFFSQFVKK